MIREDKGMLLYLYLSGIGDGEIKEMMGEETEKKVEKGVR